jgi:hypothetical protein
MTRCAVYCCVFNMEKYLQSEEDKHEVHRYIHFWLSNIRCDEQYIRILSDPDDSVFAGPWQVTKKVEAKEPL